MIDYMTEAEITERIQKQIKEEATLPEAIEQDKFHHMLTSFEHKFGIDNVKPLRKRHGKHREPIKEDDFAF